jgi:hypothetical protein
VEHTNGSAVVTRGSLVGWDYDQQAQQAVAEEAGEIARMQAELAANDFQQRQLAEVTVAQAYDQEHQTLLMSVQEGMTNVEFLARDREALLARVTQQAELLGQSRAELESLRRSVTISRGVMVDILGSRGYCLMRLLGRWRAIERGIQRALREG